MKTNMTGAPGVLDEYSNLYYVETHLFHKIQNADRRSFPLNQTNSKFGHHETARCVVLDQEARCIVEYANHP